MTATHLAPTIDGERLDIEGDAYRHLFRSRRLAVGDDVRVVDGQGRARRGTVEAVDRRRGRLVLGEPLDPREPALRVHLVVGALRPERAGWLVEKATELGVDRITFVASGRSPRDYGDGRLDRLRRMAVAAVEQCGRAWCPPIDGVVPWAEALGRLADASGIVLAPDAAAPLAEHELPSTGDVTAWVGPEGGFDSTEVAALIDRGIAAVALGATILRVETAAIVATALLLCRGTICPEPKSPESSIDATE